MQRDSETKKRTQNKPRQQSDLTEGNIHKLYLHKMPPGIVQKKVRLQQLIKYASRSMMNQSILIVLADLEFIQN